jgi:hypothetical protein
MCFFELNPGGFKSPGIAFSMGSGKPAHLTSTGGARRQCSHALQFMDYACLHGFNTSNLSIGDDRATIDMNHAPGLENQLWWCGIYKEIREVNAGMPRIQIEKVTWL